MRCDKCDIHQNMQADIFSSWMKTLLMSNFPSIKHHNVDIFLLIKSSSHSLPARTRPPSPCPAAGRGRSRRGSPGPPPGARRISCTASTTRRPGECSPDTGHVAADTCAGTRAACWGCSTTSPCSAPPSPSPSSCVRCSASGEIVTP